MRIYRSVCTYIWQDQRFPYVSDDCQLVWFHIFTNPLSTQFGLVRASVEGLAAEKNLNGTWPLDRYAKAFTEGLREGFFEYDEKALLIYFPKYFSAQHPHNHPNNPNVILGWGEWFRNIPESPLKQKCLQNLNEMVISKGKAFQEAFSKAFTEAFTKAALKPLGTEWVNRKPKPKPKPKPKREEEGEDSFPSPAYSVEQIRESWNKIVGVKICKKLDGALLQKVAKLSRQHPWSWWTDLFAEIAKSAFLSGKVSGRDGKKSFRIDLDWATGPINLGKILSGKYDDSGVQTIRRGVM